MNAKALLCVLSCLFVALWSMLLPGPALAQSKSTLSFSSVLLPLIPGIITPAPLPPPIVDEVPMPGDTYVATTGITDAGSTEETGRTLQLNTRTGSESARGVALFSSPLSSAPYVSPPTDTDLAIASPFGGPGYVAAGHPRPGDARFGRALSRRAAYDLTALGPSSSRAMESAAAGPLDAPVGSTTAAPSATMPAGSEAITGGTGK